MPNKNSQRHVSRITRDTLAIILAGGQGSRLKELTAWRAKPSVPFGGKFRIIDFPLSNCVNSGIRRISVATQYKSHSLIKHIQQGWGHFRGDFGEFVELLPAQQRVKDNWYLGTADALYQNLDILRAHDPEYVLVLAGDHIYKMDYGVMLAKHVENKADLTVGCFEVPLEEAKAFGVMAINEENRVIEFTEKPDQPKHLPGNKDVAMASMGIYIFNRDFLFEQLLRDVDNPNSSRDFGKDIIPHVVKNYRAYAYSFNNKEEQNQTYWRDVGTIDAFWKANQELIGVSPELNLYDDIWPIWTHQEQLPPAKFVFDNDKRRGMAVDSMVSGGCIISGSKVSHSLLFSNVRVNSYALIEDSVLLPGVEVGQHCHIKNAVIDKGTQIPDGTNIGLNLADDKARFRVTDNGIILVTPDMIGPKKHTLR